MNSFAFLALAAVAGPAQIAGGGGYYYQNPNPYSSGGCYGRAADRSFTFSFSLRRHRFDGPFASTPFYASRPGVFEQPSAFYGPPAGPGWPGPGWPRQSVFDYPAYPQFASPSLYASPFQGYSRSY